MKRTRSTQVTNEAAAARGIESLNYVAEHSRLIPTQPSFMHSIQPIHASNELVAPPLQKALREMYQDSVSGRDCRC